MIESKKFRFGQIALFLFGISSTVLKRDTPSGGDGVFELLFMLF